jgi:plasmid stabilization system protein ParE
LEEIGQFISKDNPPAAEKVGSRIIREAENVAAFPRSAASFQLWLLAGGSNGRKWGSLLRL